MLPHPDDIVPIAGLMRRRRRELRLSQGDVAEAVRAAGLSTVTKDEIARWERGKRIPRVRARRALSYALDLPVRALDLAAAAQRSSEPQGSCGAVQHVHLRPPHQEGVAAIRAALIDYGSSAVPLGRVDTADEPPEPADLWAGLSSVMSAYQSSRYAEMIAGLPEQLACAHTAVQVLDGDLRHEAQRVLALSCHAAAMVLSKLGELDLAWAAAERGMSVAALSGDPVVACSLSRSVVHTLQSHGRAESARRLADSSADRFRAEARLDGGLSASVYGTLLLASAVSAARAGDRPATLDYLDEAEACARSVGKDANHLWTAFGPTNVEIHRVAAAVALDDMQDARRRIGTVNAASLPVERRVRYAFDVARTRVAHRQVDEAISTIVDAERLAPEQVHRHVIGQQIVATLRRTVEGRRSPELAQLSQRIPVSGHQPAWTSG